MQNDLKEVDYHKYCPKCEHHDTKETDDPCNECLTYPMNTQSHKPIHYKGPDIPYVRDDSGMYPKKITKVQDYLWEVEFTDIDYDYANKYYLNTMHIPNVGGCSSFRKDNLVGRKLDWTYDDNVEFVVRTPRIGNRYASIGISGAISGMTEQFMQSGKKADILKLIPFQMQDGINEWGLYVSTNVVPTDFGKNPPSEPWCGTKVQVSALMLIRYILDHFMSATAAANYISDCMSVYFPKGLHDLDYEMHWMIADLNKTYVVEIHNARVYLRNVTRQPILTNFLLYGVRFNPDGTVYTPETKVGAMDAQSYNFITPHGSGLERHNLIVEGLKSNRSVHDILNDLKYTRAYTTSPNPSNPYWYTEFVGGDLTVSSDPENFTEIVDKAGRLYQNRTRNGKTWQSTHSVMYNLINKSLTVEPQESGNNYIYFL